jgi:hypothetical protein
MTTEEMSATDNPVLAAIRAKRGLASELGRHLGITRSAVWMWTRVPPQHALSVAKFLKLHPHEVCPDLYPAPRRARAP